MRTPKHWQPIPNSENSGWLVHGYIVRRQHDAYFIRANNGTGWGNGDMLACSPTQRHVEARIAELRS